MLDSIIRRCDTDEDELLNYAEFSETVKHTTLAVSEKPTDVNYTWTMWASSPLRNSSPMRESR